MAEDDLPEHVRKFVFNSIDSVELLEVLLILSASRDRFWSAGAISAEMRSNANSVEKRLVILKRIGLVEESAAVPGDYRYAPKRAEWEVTVSELAILYATKKHRILELIFTPLKSARAIANAFLFNPKKPGGGESNG